MFVNDSNTPLLEVLKFRWHAFFCFNRKNMFYILIKLLYLIIFSLFFIIESILEFTISFILNIFGKCLKAMFSWNKVLATIWIPFGFIYDCIYWLITKVFFCLFLLCILPEIFFKTQSNVDNYHEEEPREINVKSTNPQLILPIKLDPLDKEESYDINHEQIMLNKLALLVFRKIIELSDRYKLTEDSVVLQSISVSILLVDIYFAKKAHLTNEKRLSIVDNLATIFVHKMNSTNDEKLGSIADEQENVRNLVLDQFEHYGSIFAGASMNGISFVFENNINKSINNKFECYYDDAPFIVDLSKSLITNSFSTEILTSLIALIDGFLSSKNLFS